MGAGYHGGFGKTKGAGRIILSAESKSSALDKTKSLPKNIKSSYTKYVKDTTTSKYTDYNITKIFLQAGENAGTKVAAGLPNITGGWNNVGVEPGYGTASGAFYNNIVGGTFFYHGSGRGGNQGGFYLNASRSSSIYGKSNTVQPPSQIVHFCIKYR